MLSSVAVRCYWAGRYLERAENMSRLINVYTGLLLDLPKEAGVDWRQLIDVCGNRELFDSHRSWLLERSAVRFLTFDTENPSSVISSIRYARENLRTLRDIVPREGFEAVNELYLFANARLKRATYRRARYDLLNEVISRCQRVTGVLAGTMNHTEPYQFIRIGRNLERADMTTRILDVAGELLEKEHSVLSEFETSLWVNVLRSASAYQAYRQTVRSRIVPIRVVYFLLADRLFPRSVSHCLDEIEASIQKLPVNTPVLEATTAVRDFVMGLNLRELVRESLHMDLDSLQAQFSGLDNAINETWFVPKEIR
jgi:uncharacterized alpha-E superfamily protein